MPDKTAWTLKAHRKFARKMAAGYAFLSLGIVGGFVSQDMLRQDLCDEVNSNQATQHTFLLNFQTEAIKASKTPKDTKRILKFFEPHLENTEPTEC